MIEGTTAVWKRFSFIHGFSCMLSNPPLLFFWLGEVRACDIGRRQVVMLEACVAHKLLFEPSFAYSFNFFLRFFSSFSSSSFMVTIFAHMFTV